MKLTFLVSIIGALKIKIWLTAIENLSLRWYILIVKKVAILGCSAIPFF
jgi:hypothetical protein